MIMVNFTIFILYFILLIIQFYFVAGTLSVVLFLRYFGLNAGMPNAKIIHLFDSRNAYFFYYSYFLSLKTVRRKTLGRDNKKRNTSVNSFRCTCMLFIEH